MKNVMTMRIGWMNKSDAGAGDAGDTREAGATGRAHGALLRRKRL